MSRSEGARFQTRSDTEFNKDNFLERTIQPFITSLIEEIERAFEIPPQLKGFTVLDPESIPSTKEGLKEFGIDGVASLGDFYGSVSNKNPGILDPTSLPAQYEAYKTFVLKKRIDYEVKQREALNKATIRLEGEKSKLSTLSDILSKRKKIAIEKNIKKYESEKHLLSKKQNYSFEVALEQWIGSNYAERHPEITKLLNLAALIPPSTAEVERSFSLMKLICTKLRKRLTNENLTALMRICKYQGDIDYEDIKNTWLKADDTKSKTRRVNSRLR